MGVENTTSRDAVAPVAPAVVSGIATAVETSRNPRSRDKNPQQNAFRPAGTLVGPTELLAWVLGLLGIAACVAPWLARGWLWFGIAGLAVALLASYDAFAVWLARNE